MNWIRYPIFTHNPFIPWTIERRERSLQRSGSRVPWDLLVLWSWFSPAVIWK